jgi:hypothetical protein
VKCSTSTGLWNFAAAVGLQSKIMTRLILSFVFIAAAMIAAVAQDATYANVNFLVLKDTNGKPVRNASVILHSVNEKGKQEKGGFQLKTDAEGKAKYDGVPYGKIRIQVIARGLQTYGEDYDINQPQMELTIKMKPPQEQYTIYK